MFYKHIITTLLLTLPLSLLAENPAINTGLCSDSIVNQPPITTTQNDKTVIRADNTSTQGDTFTLKGNVIIQNQNQTLQANHITYDKVSGDAMLQGNITLKQKGLTINAEQGRANTKDKTAQFKNLEYELPGNAGRGSASTAKINSDETTILDNITYTTCRKGNEDWLIKADQITLDQKEEVGYGTHVILKIKDLPIFYFPKFSFPLGEKRKSGFLTPKIGTSSSAGTEINIPWYWNIAPNQDATFNLRYMSIRGTQLNAEYRHLHTTAMSTLRLEYLNDSITGDNKSLISMNHSGRYLGNWKVRAKFSRVSNQQYFDDLGQGFNRSSVTHLTRVITVRQDNQYGYLLARAHEFQSLNTENTYQRLPQLRMDFATSSHKNQFRYSLQSELTRFEHQENIISGTRLDLLPGIEYNWAKPAYYLRPKLMFRYTRYHLNDLDINQESTINRSTPIASLDAGLFFDRRLNFAGRNHTLTIEPRLYYLYAQYDNQSKLPIFDTSQADFRFAELFRHNQFTGPDRQSNANQLTLATTSRLIEAESGREWLRISIGQTFYFQDRLITLPGQSVPTVNSSDFVAEFEARINPQNYLRISSLWNTAQNQANRSIVSYRYRQDDKHRIAMSYRYQRNIFEQTDISARWQLSPKWHAIGRWTYSLRNKQTIDSLAGLEYENCCWSIQIAGRRSINSNDISDNVFYIQLNLKGLSNFGDNIYALLKDEE